MGRTALILMLGMVAMAGRDVGAAGFLRAQGKFIGNDTGLVQLRGLGLGGWMLQEGYMFGTADFAGTQHEIRAKLESVVGAERTEAFYRKWRTNFVTRRDIDTLASWGFNAIRLPMHWNLYMEPGMPVRWKDEGFRMTDSLLAWCEANRIWVILDLHAAPGGQGHDRNISDRDTAVSSLWDDPDKRAMVVALWRKLAERYADEQWIGGYDLLNETNWGFEGKAANGCSDEVNAPLRQLHLDMTAAIRAVDRNHLLFVEGNCWGNNHAGMMPPWDSNLAISFHKYWNGTEAGTVNPFFQIRDTWNIPIWCGESGENGNEWFRRTIRMFESERIGWSWWPYKKIESVVGPLSVSSTPGWDAFVAWGKGGPKPDPEQLWKGLEELADNLRLEKCQRRPDVVDAMFRQVRTDATRPWREIRVPGRWGAEEYDLGAEGAAYHDAASLNTGGVGSTNWNEGWSFRNDGVDLQWSKEEGGWNVGWTAAGEWLQYTIDVDSAARYLLVARTAGPGGRLEIQLDGRELAAFSTTPTTGWTSWADSRSPDFALPAGRHVLRLVFPEGGFNLGGIRMPRATEACLATGNCPVAAERRVPAPSLAWTAAGLVYSGAAPAEILVADPAGRTVFRGRILPGEAVPGTRASGLLLVSLDGRTRSLIRP